MGRRARANIGTIHPGQFTDFIGFDGDSMVPQRLRMVEMGSPERVLGGRFGGKFGAPKLFFAPLSNGRLEKVMQNRHDEVGMAFAANLLDLG